MNPRELVDHIRSGPVEVKLNKPLRFHYQTCSNPCDFNEFLLELGSSETIQTVSCKSQLVLQLGIDEWVLLVKTIGSIKCIDHLTLWCDAGSHNFDPFQAVADAVNSAHSLHTLRLVVRGETFPRDSSGLTALANALGEHAGLRYFVWLDSLSQREATQITALDYVFQVLPACPQLRAITIDTKSASTDALKSLLQLRSAIDLCLVLYTTENWLAVVDEFRLGRCLIKTLHLGMLHSSSSKATEALQALAGAIQMDRNLEYLSLEIEDGFTDEAGVALAKALTVNKTLRKITLDDNPVSVDRTLLNTAALGANAYEALSAMLRVNTSLVLKLPPFESDSSNERLRESRYQLHIEQRLNHVGRRRLLMSTQTTREQWADALHELTSGNVDDSPASPAFQVSCLYSVLRSSPAVVRMS